MTRPRHELISLADTSYYHCINRCVRRAFLCGEDHLTGKNYEHRKLWVVERLSLLSQVFAIDIAAYAVMSNHLHLVLRVNTGEAEQWSDQQIMDHWSLLFQLPVLISRYQHGEANSEAEICKAKEILSLWRERLMNISWFMRSLNEHLARRANQEDRCTGRFWEGRFKSQALLDEAAVLTCMSYVDLNPIRAKITLTPEDSDYTSIQQRIRRLLPDTSAAQNDSAETTLPTLMPLIPLRLDTHHHAIGYSEDDYLQLVDWAGRLLIEGKRGAIAKDAPPILTRLGLDPEGYLEHIQGRPMTPRPRVIGHVEHIKKAAAQMGQCFLKGMCQAKRLYLSPG